MQYIIPNYLTKGMALLQKECAGVELDTNKLDIVIDESGEFTGTDVAI